jgi:hypothetical protein
MDKEKIIQEGNRDLYNKINEIIKDYPYDIVMCSLIEACIDFNIKDVIKK